MSPSGRVSAFGIDLGGVPKFTMGVIGIVIAVVIAYKFIVDPEIRVTTEKQANAQLLLEITEMGRHIAETPDATVTIFDDARGKFLVSHYPDDCFLPVRTDPSGKTFSKLILGLASEERTADLSSLLVVPVSAAGQPESVCNRVYHGRLAGQSNPWRDGCFLYFRRYFEDGCSHVQALDTCNNNVWWAPYWEVCRH